MLDKERSFKVLFTLSIIAIILIGIATGTLSNVIGKKVVQKVSINGGEDFIRQYGVENIYSPAMNRFSRVDPNQVKNILYLRLSTNNPLDEIIKILNEDYPKIAPIEELISKLSLTPHISSKSNFQMQIIEDMENAYKVAKIKLLEPALQV